MINNNVAMKHGKHICNALKQVRLDIARANGIEYQPRECHHEGDCAGTCPACESEMLNKADNDVLQGEVELVGDSCATSDSIGDVRIQSGEMVDSTECQPIMNKEPADKL